LKVEDLKFYKENDLKNFRTRDFIRKRMWSTACTKLLDLIYTTTKWFCPRSIYLLSTKYYQKGDLDN